MAKLCGESNDLKRLKEVQSELSAQRAETAKKDAQIRDGTSRLVSLVGLRNQQLQLESEMEAHAVQHREALACQHRQLKQTHGDEMRWHLDHSEQAAHAALEAPVEELSSQYALSSTSELSHDEELAEATQQHQLVIASEEHHFASTRTALLQMQSEVMALRQERDSEEEAARVTQEAYLAEHRASLRKSEVVSTEMRKRQADVLALEDAQRDLNGQTKALQHELSKVAYTVGQRDHELNVKEAELREVRRGIVGIQDDMDKVNQQLREQCERVQRVERELSISRDLNDKVRHVREMLQESHTGIAQLCGLVDEERQKREQFSQGLKQQRLRTELLLQLLHHFKSRTQDLAPQAMLAGLATSAEDGGLQEALRPPFGVGQ
eukprot:TRINITY_DN2025_c0_g1_i1.p1 TRINITY_DN2025_c0_g1~~TRINITY_DN2025_c0_g1_i1.p1  ORF type:complete len:380 (-),score=82.98 TRINITY_DN2025_c0_g1_i1:34-1173(-)